MAWRAYFSPSITKTRCCLDLSNDTLPYEDSLSPSSSLCDTAGLASLPMVSEPCQNKGKPSHRSEDLRFQDGMNPIERSRGSLLTTTEGG